jgi:methylenetetrahydrofolate reductase (NADPH)
MTSSNIPPRFATTLRQRLEAGDFAITAEVTPPLSCDPQDLLDKAAPLRGLVDAVNVTDGAGARVALSASAAAALLAKAGFEVVLQLTCRDRNRLALQADRLGAAAFGLRNLLILTGDDPAAGDQPDAKPVFDLDSRRLIETAARLRDRGELPTGKPVAGRAAFFIGAADMPIDPPPGWRPDGLKAKIAAGAQFTQTQFCMDAGVMRRYTARLADEGVKIHTLVGIAPLRSARGARWMRANLYGTIIPDAVITRLEAAADPIAEGRRIALDLVAELADIKGVAGVHVMAPGQDAAAAALIAAIRDAHPLQRQATAR